MSNIHGAAARVKARAVSRRRQAAFASGVVASFFAAAVATAKPSDGAVLPIQPEVLQVADTEGIPADIDMIALNVTAVDPLRPGYISVYPCDGDRPETSNVNYVAGQIAPNLVLSRVGADGTVCIFTLEVTDVLVDVVGYVPDGSSITPLDSSKRLLDTRDTHQNSVEPGSSVEVPLHGVAGVPDSANLALLNVTAVAGTDAGYLTVFPCDEERPPTSSVNYLGGDIVPNAVASRIGFDGSVCVFTLETTDIIVDVVAYASAGIVPLQSPERVSDTRLSGVVQPAGGELRIDIGARPNIPTDATAAVYNLTSVDSTAPGYASGHGCETNAPEVSNLNYGPGQIVSNGAITKLSADGEICIFNLAPTHLVVDLVAYVAGDVDYIPVDPFRAFDSRRSEPSCRFIVVPHSYDDSLSSNVYKAKNLVTGEVTTVSVPFDLLGLAVDTAGMQAVSTDCESLLSPVDRMPAERAETWIQPLLGGPATKSSDVATRGPIIALRDGSVVSLVNRGTILNSVPPFGETIWDSQFESPSGFTTLSRDGSVTVGLDFSGGEVHVWNPATNREISRFAVPYDGASRVDVSDDGSLLVLDTVLVDRANDFENIPIQVVTTLDGSIVAERRSDDVWHSRFVGATTVLGCGRSGLYEWHVHAGSRLLERVDGPLFAGGRDPWGTRCTQMVD